MAENILVRFFEHNNWANLRIIQACAALSDEQLDAEPRSSTKGSIRRTLWHLVASQQGYLSYLSGQDRRSYWQAAPTFDELRQAALTSGEELVALVREACVRPPEARLQTRDGYWVDPWVLMVQIINHAHEHREQISSMLTALGVTPPDNDGWTYGEATNALVLASA